MALFTMSNHVLQVVFDAQQLDANSSSKDFHDTIVITSEAGSVELPVHAGAPKPQLQLDGDLQFSLQCVDSAATKQLRLLNRGKVPAEYSITWDR
jgi:ubiquinone biosynthesis protein UbiJ